MNREELPVIIFGTAGAAKDVYYWIKAASEKGNGTLFHVEGFIEYDEKRIGETAFAGIKVIGCDDRIGEVISKYDRLGAVVPFGDPALRKKVVDLLSDYPNLVFPNVMHPSVIYDPSGGSIGVGNCFGPGTIIESEYKIGDFNYINGGVQLSHDIIIGDFNSFNPSSAVAGNVTFGDCNMLGINATVIQNITITDGITIGAGAVVTRSLRENGVYAGVPAKRMK